MGLSLVPDKSHVRYSHEIYMYLVFFNFFLFQNKMSTLHSKARVFVLIVLTGNNV